MLDLPKFEFAPLELGVAGPRDYTSIGAGEQDIYTYETTQRHAYGRAAWTWDGRLFRYSRSLGSVKSGFGAANIAAQNIGAVIPVAADVGDWEVTVTIAGTDGHAGNGVIAKDELCGGYLVCGHGETLVNNRTIMANTAVAATGGTCRVRLDGPIAHAMTAASSYLEIVLNPHRYLSKGSYDYQAFMGVPAVNAESGYNFWNQRRGPCWVTPGGADTTPGNTADDRTAYFVGDGSVNFGYALTIEDGYQEAGYCIDNTAGVSALPLIFLTLE